MTAVSTRTALSIACVLVTTGLAGPAAARGGSGSGSGLSPYAAETGNDRSAGVNNGNYRDPRLDPYIQTYGSRYDQRRSYRQRYYGYPY